MTGRRFWFEAVLLCLFAVSPLTGSHGQAGNYPSGPVKIISQQAPGGGADVAIRLVTEGLSKRWGKQAVLVDMPGAGGLIAARAAASAPPDGMTLFMALASAFVVLPQTHARLPFDIDDFVPVGFVGEVPMGVAVSPALPVKSLPELIALSKRTPGGLTAAVSFRGSLPNLTTELFRIRSGADITSVYYPGSAQAMSDVTSGRVPVLIDGLGGPAAAGGLKLLAIASPNRLASHSDVPTVAETVPGFAASGWFVLVAPHGTPVWIVDKLNRDLRAVLAEPYVSKRFAALSTSSRPLSPKEVGDFIRSEQQLWKPVVRRLNFLTP
ncbi:MAG TPA: tripartite tricarboxylate transporter substrate binding protein [Pseudolabrys sp.]|nr:tripartite tricarboxylate transporter substrate binding protein [Pseudolabrys sp.]